MWSAPVLIEGPAAEPVTLAQAKAFVSIDESEDCFDEQIASFIAAASQQVEAVCGIQLMPQTLSIGASCWDDLAQLPVGPVSELLALSYQDATGPVLALDLADFELFGAGLARGIRPVAGNSWPGGVRRAADAITVRLVAGYDAVPLPIVMAIKLMIGDLHAHRETAVVGTIAAKVPTSMQVDVLLANYRRWL